LPCAQSGSGITVASKGWLKAAVRPVVTAKCPPNTETGRRRLYGGAPADWPAHRFGRCWAVVSPCGVSQAHTQVKPLAGTEPSLVAGLNVQCTVSTSSAGSNVPFAFVSWNTVIVADVNAMSVMKFLLQPSAWTASLGVNTRHRAGERGLAHTSTPSIFRVRNFVCRAREYQISHSTASVSGGSTTAMGLTIPRSCSRWRNEAGAVRCVRFFLAEAA